MFEGKNSMEATDPIGTLAAVDGVRRNTQNLFDAAWFPLLVWGSIVLASAPFTQLAGGDAVGYFWLIAAPIGVFVTFRFFRVRQIDLGLVARHKTTYIATSLSIAAGSMGLGIAGHGNLLSAAGPVFAVVAGLAVFAAIDRSALLAFSAVMLAAFGAVVVLAEPSRTTLWAAIGEGMILIATGLVAARGGEARGLVKA